MAKPTLDIGNLLKQSTTTKSRLKSAIEPTKKGKGRPKSLDPVVIFPIGIKQSEVNDIVQRASELKINKHALGQFLLRSALQQLKDGKLQVKTEKVTTIKISQE